MRYLFEIKKEVEGKRLDLAIPLLNNSLSRSQVKKVIEENKLLVNGVTEYRANYKVRIGDKIEFEIDDISSFDKIIPQKMELDILYEDEDLLIINKPEGIVTHPATGNWSGTVMNGLMYKYKDLANVGDPIRSGLIHRIDKDTSGILLIGKTNKGLWHYSKLFSQREVEKYYLALVSGDISRFFDIENTFVQKNYIARHPGDRKKMAVVGKFDQKNLPPDSRIAETRFRLLDSNKDYSVVMASPKTGRTHQIRVHLQNLGYPIVGDNIYNGEKKNRLMLHAYKIKIKNINGSLMEIIAPPPKSFIEIFSKTGLKIPEII